MNTVTAVAELYDGWIRGVERGEMSSALLLDQTAAFDLLDHRILGNKLREYNFSPKTISWILSFLGGRSQYVRVGNKRSEERRIGGFSTPQGSVLGGLLHNISTNDLCWTKVEKASRTVFVDDSTASVSAKDVMTMQKNLQSQLG